jgi:hypothetical protein
MLLASGQRAYDKIRDHGWYEKAPLTSGDSPLHSNPLERRNPRAAEQTRKALRNESADCSIRPVMNEFD